MLDSESRYRGFRVSKAEEEAIMYFVKRLWREEEGQDLTEYTLLLAAMALAAVALILGPSHSVNTIWSTGNSQLTTARSIAAS